MTGGLLQGGTIFVFERKTLWLSDMRGKTNWLRIWAAIIGVETLGEFLKRPSVPKASLLKINNTGMLGRFNLSISHILFIEKTSDMLTATFELIID